VVRPPPRSSSSRASKSQAVAQAFTGRRLQRLGPAVQATSPSLLAFESQGPSSFVPLLQLGAASGLKGHLRAFPLQQSMVVDAQSGELVSSAAALFLSSAKKSWLKTSRGQWLLCKQLSFSPGLETLLASNASARLRVSLDACQHRSQAETIQHSELGLEADELERLSQPFWRVFDWVNWQAFGPSGKPLGRIGEVLASKFQAVLRLEADALNPNARPSAEMASSLVPVVPRYILQVSSTQKQLVLDWAL
jgi:ribosomal 30S subunit maturation factor RimM